jgi:branched-chain amino acid transport system ATP-binding protein
MIDKSRLPETNDTELIRLTHVTRTYGRVIGVNDLDVALPQGAYALVGPNGAGKTTLFNLISGVLTPSSGSIKLDGVELTGFRPDRIARMGLVRTFQGVRLFHSMTALENVQAGCYIRTSSELLAMFIRIPGRESKQEAATRHKAMAILERVGLTRQVNSKAGDLTLADQRRLEIARALATEPRILLLDEPAAGMNPAETDALIAVLRQIRADHRVGLLVVEHDLKLIMRLCDHIVVLNKGQMIAEGTPEEIRANPAVIEAYIGKRRAAA